MTTPVSLTVPTLAEAARWAPEQIVALAQANAAAARQIDALRLEFQAMKHQLDSARVKVVVASVMQPAAEYGCPPNAL